MKNKSVFKIVSIFLLILLLIFSSFLSGLRFTPFQAVKANQLIKGETTILGEIDRDWGNIYILQTQDGIKTAFSEKRGFMWRCPSTTYIYDDIIKNDKVKTIGCTSVIGENGNEITVFAVQSCDPEVKYIEAGPDSDRQRKSIASDETVIFEWDKIVINDVNAVAYNEDDQQIYKFEYNPEHLNFTDAKELRWYPTSDVTGIVNELSAAFEKIGYAVEYSQGRENILIGVRSVLELTNKANKEVIQIYAYPTSELAAEDITRLDEAGSTYSILIGTQNMKTCIDWVDMPHFYLIDNAIILYVGSNSDVCNALIDVCGKQVKGM